MSQAVSMYTRGRKSRDTVPWAANEMQEMRVATPPPPMVFAMMRYHDGIHGMGPTIQPSFTASVH